MVHSGIIIIYSVIVAFCAKESIWILIFNQIPEQNLSKIDTVGMRTSYCRSVSCDLHSLEMISGWEKFVEDRTTENQYLKQWPRIGRFNYQYTKWIFQLCKSIIASHDPPAEDHVDGKLVLLLRWRLQKKPPCSSSRLSGGIIIR